MRILIALFFFIQATFQLGFSQDAGTGGDGCVNVKFQTFSGPVSAIDGMSFLSMARNGKGHPVLPTATLAIITKYYSECKDVSTKVETVSIPQNSNESIMVNNSAFNGQIVVGNSPQGPVLSLSGGTYKPPSYSIKNLIVRHGTAAILPGPNDGKNVGVLLILND